MCSAHIQTSKYGDCTCTINAHTQTHIPTTVRMNSTKVQNPWRNSYAGTGCRHLHQATAYTTALSVTHARISLPHASRLVYGENEPVSRIKMADNHALVVWERYSYLRNEAIIRKTPNLNTSEHYTEIGSMPTLSLSCVSCR